MSIKVTSNFRKAKTFSKPTIILDKIGKIILGQIRVKTQVKFVDADNKAFKDYSPEYAAYRRKKGRSDNVNLSFTGRMMNSLGMFNITANSVEIGLSAGNEINKATYIEEGGREFLGVSKQDEKVIEKEIDTYINSEIESKL
jgi:phage gpG-like protein